MIYVNNFEVSFIKFSGGELHFSLSDEIIESINESIDGLVPVEAHLRNSDDIMLLFLVTDAIRQVHSKAKIEVFIPYFPYARQDRVANAGESLSVKVLATLINSQCYEKVTICDPHSDVTTAVLDRVEVIPQHLLVEECLMYESDEVGNNYVVIAPDAGAMKKAKKFADAHGFPIVFATKTRDSKTGKLSNTKIDFDGVDVSGKRLIVVDDICDGGRTFLNLADAIKEALGDSFSTIVSLELYITHGIFSAGLDALREKYNRIHTANLIGEYEGQIPNVLNLGNK